MLPSLQLTKEETYVQDTQAAHVRLAFEYGPSNS